MSRQAVSVVRGFSKPRRISVHNGPAAGGGYVLRTGLKVKAGGNHRTDGPLPQRLSGLVKIDGQAGRSGRARTCDPRFWRLMFRLTIFYDRYFSLCETPDFHGLPSVFDDDG